ncbi:MAG: TrkH family potassium uptake protein [Gallionellaceae bacterium]|jgi:trk system potassium uptake protein TrkH
MVRSLTVVHVLGMMLALFSVTYILPIITSIIYQDGTLLDFVLAMMMTFLAGTLMWLLTRRYKSELSIRHGYLLVVMMWTAIPAFATLPLLIVLPNLSFTGAYFETMSGLTTSGGTVLTGLDNLPQAVNIWRHELVWLGGMGIIVLVVAIMPLLGIGGRQLYKAETPGPMKDSTLTPRITETARSLWLVYLGITVACIISLKLAGMSWFDAVCHAFSAMGLGGFSTHDASIEYFHSPLIEFVMIIFMLVAVINFATHFLALREKSLRVYLRDVEGKSSVMLLLVSCVVIALLLWWKGVYPSFWTSLRYASFNLISIATSAGYSNTDFSLWPIFAPLWMLFLSSIGASSGSTGGGIKMIRTIILFKQAGREFTKLLHPSAIAPMKINGSVVPNNIVFSVLAFIFLYFIIVVVLVFAMLISGLDFMTAFTAILASINNVGPGLGQVGPASNYSGLTVFQTWLCTFAMLIGRLEIITLLIVFTPKFWKR